LSLDEPLNLSRLNESARLQANMMLQFQNRDFKKMLKNRGDQGEATGNAPEDAEDAQY